MDGSADIAASMCTVAGVSIALGAYAVSSAAAGHLLVEERVERERALPLVGRAPMHAVYRLLGPIARGLASAGISANAITVTSLFLACVAGVLFARGHFGVGALAACAAAVADGLDGLVARVRKTDGHFGKVLDTMVDRYVDAVLIGGIAFYVRDDGPLLVVALAAMVGAAMVSYASSVERELGVVGKAPPMRRAHRLAYLLGGAALVPFVTRLLHLAGIEVPRAGLAPVFAAVTAIAVIGNVSAVRRLLAAARSTSST